MRQKENRWPGVHRTYTDTIRADLDLEANPDHAPVGRPSGASASHVYVPERHGLMLGGLEPTLVVFLFDIVRVHLRIRSY